MRVHHDLTDTSLLLSLNIKVTSSKLLLDFLPLYMCHTQLTSSRFPSTYIDIVS